MSEDIQRIWPVLLLLEKSSPKLRVKLLQDLIENKSFRNFLEEIFINVEGDTLKLSSENEAKLKKKKKIIKALTDIPKNYKSKAKRKQAATQIGGFLPILIPSLIAVIGELIRK